MQFKALKEHLHKEAYLIPLILCLFFVPLFYIPSFIQTFTQGKEILFKSLAIITLLFLAISIVQKRKFQLKPIYNSSLFIILLCGLCLIVIADAVSPTPIITLYGTPERGFGLIIDLFLFGLILYGACTLSKVNIQKLFKWISVGGIIIASYAIMQKVKIDPLFGFLDKDIFEGRVFSFLGNPGYLGQYILLIGILNTYLLLSTTKIKEKIFFGLGIFLSFSALFLSGTRTSLIALFICALLFMVKYRKNIISTIKNKLSKKIIASFFVLITLLIIVSQIIPSERFSISGNSLRSLYSRFEIWNGTVQLIAKKTLFGYGAETYYIYSPETISKSFLTLEENINLIIDKPHNEFLEIFFSYGIFSVFLYIILAIYLLKLFFSSKDPLIIILSLLVITNGIQNQFSFSDISIKIFISFCLGGIIALQTSKIKPAKISLGKFKYPIIVTIILISLFAGYKTIYNPIMSQISYAKSHANYSINYEIAINEHKRALSFTPYYSAFWYELMFIDPTSMERALFNLEQIEGNSGNVLAWKGNFFRNTEPAKASQFYLQALEKNPYYPNWIRSYADMLYKYEDYENALYLYKQYLESVPDFWKWKDDLGNRSPEEQKTYRIFLKHVPDFWTTVQRVEEIEKNY